MEAPRIIHGGMGGGGGGLSECTSTRGGSRLFLSRAGSTKVSESSREEGGRKEGRLNDGH